MNICFISSYSSTNQGGATLSMFDVANELAKRGNKIIIVLNSRRNLEKIYKEKNVRCIIAPSFNMRINLKEIEKMTNIKFCVKYYWNFIYTYKLYQRLKKEKIDIIHINGLNNRIGADIAKKLHIPYVWHIRQLLEEDLSQTIFKKKKLWKQVEQADTVIAISKVVQKKFEQELKRKINIVYNGVPISKYLIPKHEIFKEETVNLLIAGRIDTGKGQLDAVKAINILKEKGIHLYMKIVGGVEDKEYMEKIVKYIDENNLLKEISIYNHVEDLNQIRNKSDIGLTCSKNEAFGRVTIENQLAGMLVIGANTGGTKEIIDDNHTGLLYEEGNAVDLSKKLEFALANSEVMKNIAKRGQEKAIETYSITRVVNQVEEIYVACLGEGV